jgi:hypothetical protein
LGAIDANLDFSASLVHEYHYLNDRAHENIAPGIPTGHSLSLNGSLIWDVL